MDELLENELYLEVTLTLCQHHAYQRRGTVVDHPRHFSSWVSKLTLIGYFNELK